jgi:cobalt-zinc-cadmium efflux system membrane fusion protein
MFGRLVIRLSGLGLFGVLLIVVWLNWSWLTARSETRTSGSSPSSTHEVEPRIELVPDRPGVVRVPAVLFDTPRFRTTQVAPAPAPEPLRLPGSIILDPNRLARIHSLFSGQIVKIGIRGDLSKTSERLSVVPENGLRPGDEVKKGQILAVLWCKDVGEKKSELVDQMSQLRADRKVLERYESVDPGVVTLNTLTTARRAYETSVNNVARVERTLRSWQLTEEEIDAVKREADKLQQPNVTRDREVERSWAEVPIRAPFDGMIVEKNVTIGDIIDPTVDLFKLAKLDRLQVLAHVYEEDLTKIQQLEPPAEESDPATTSPTREAILRAAGKARAWTITFQADGTAAAEEGCFEKIGAVIDPNQHTGTVTGWVDNKHGKLFIGQFVTATIPLKPDPTLVAVPASAVVEASDGSVVFVQADAASRAFCRRKVAVVIRGRETIFLRAVPTPSETVRGAEPIRVGETVIERGALEMAGELDALRAEGGK